jgi:hypothetical protein
MVAHVDAQVESATIVGTVRDSSGAVVADALVTVVNTETNIANTVRSSAVGEYIFTQLKPGAYAISAEKQGFKKTVHSAVKLDVNQVARIDIKLVLGTVTEEVRVEGAEPLVEAETSSIGQVIEESRVVDLPLNGRNFIQLAYLSPGVNAGPDGIVQQGGIPENERANGAIQVNGLMATNNNFLLNGFDNNEQQIGFEVILPAVDAIQEFKVQTNNFGADIGKGGAVVNVVLKSGTNDFHGSAYEFLRNSALDAKNYFDDPASPIPPFKQNQFGATFGGPIIKDKTFFFGDYQGTRIRQAQTFISSVPLLSERGGDFSDLGYPIYDPLTTQVDGSRTAFPNNVIPPCVGSTGRSASGGGCLDPAALNVVKLYPKPNLPGGFNNFLFNPVARNNQDSFDIRVDHLITAKDSFFGSFSFNNVDAYHPDPFPGLAGGGSFSGTIKNKARAIGLSDVHTFSANKINEFKIGYMRYVVNAVQNFADQDISAQMGIPGINDPNRQIATGGLININFSEFSALGVVCCFPEFLTENNYQVLDSFTYIRGKHTLKLGGDLRLRRHGFFQALNPQGTLYFDQQFTADLTNPDVASGSSLASFLLGYPISAARDGQKEPYGMSWWEISVYAMDDFRVSPKLTLNLGLRYDVFTPMVEDQDRLANFDFATGNFVSPQMPGVSRAGNVVKDLNNFAPRVGFAYTPWSDNKTVLRGGFGIFYDLQANQNDTELAYNPTGLFFSQNINNPATTPSIRLSTGFPAPTYPTVSNPSGRTSAAFFDNRTTYIEEWNLNVERQLVRNMVLQVAYVGTHALKLAFLSNLNQPAQPLDSNFSDSTGNFGRPYFNTVPDVGPIRTESHQYSSISHALQARFEKRFSAGWSMLNSYTWQHTIGQAEENEWLEPQNTHDLRAERGDNGPDYRHQFTSAWSYELPFGPGKRVLTAGGPARWFTQGWQLNGILGMYSGAAVTPLLSFDPTNTGSGAPRPDLIGDPNNFSNATSVGCPSNRQSLLCWYNPAAFAIPVLAPGQTFAHLFGNARRGILRGPAHYNVDFSVFKDFHFTERFNLQFRTEFFNLFNTPSFGSPANGVDAPGAGSISSAGPSRQIQLALKLTF